MAFVSALRSFKVADTAVQATAISILSILSSVTFANAPLSTIKSLPPYGKPSVSNTLGMCSLSFDSKEFCESLLLKFRLVMFHHLWTMDAHLT